MTDLSPDEQALFEAWALARGLSAADNHGQYRSYLTYLAAAAWSACLAAKREVWQPIETAPKNADIQPTPTEIEVLRKDAERYRWLRDVGQDTAEVFFATDKNASGWGAWDSHEDKDAAIDAAIRAEKGE